MAWRAHEPYGALISLSSVSSRLPSVKDASDLVAWGASEEIFERVIGSLSASIRSIRDRYNEPVKTSLGGGAFEIARAEGRAMPLVQAIALARAGASSWLSVRGRRADVSCRLGARDFGDEPLDVPLDLGWWQVVAGEGVRLAEIAADDEGAQPRAGKALRLCDAEAADHLHRGGLADPLEDGAGHVTEIVALDESGVGAPRVGLQVNADAVHTGLEHAAGDLDGLRGRALVRHEDIGEREPRQFGAGAPELVAHGADRLRRIRTGKREEVNDVAAPRVDGARLEGTAIHGLHVGQEERLGKLLPEGWHHVRDACVFEQRRPHFDDADPSRQRRTGNRATLLQGGHVD